MFQDLIGNQHVQEALQNELPSPMLFYGIPGVGKKTFARAYFAKLLKKKCENHPDFRLFAPEGKAHVHTVASMHQFINEMDTTPYNAEHKCILIESADRFSDASANAILKTLEEHPHFVSIILVTNEIDRVIPTINSRCLKVPFHPASPEEVAQFVLAKGNVCETEAQRIVSLAHGSFGRALGLLEQGIGEGERLLRELLAKPNNRTIYDQIDKFVGDDRKLGLDLLILLSRLLKGKEQFSEKFLDAWQAYNHHMRISNVLESLLLFS